MEKLVDTVVGTGIPGIILMLVMATTGVYGAAAMASALVIIGPGGMLGGVATLVFIGIITAAFTQYGQEAFLKAVLECAYDRGISADQLKENIRKAWYISKSTRLKIINFLDKFK